MDKRNETTSEAKSEEETTEAYLVLKEEFYNRIKGGTKKTEYRDFTEYWVKRLLSHPLKTVKLNLGYTEEHMIFEIDWIGVIDENDHEIHAFNNKGEMNDEGKEESFLPRYISIHLGKRIH